MENKKEGIIIASLAVILFVSVAFIFMYEPARNKFTNLINQKEKFLPLECDYKNEQAMFTDAIEKVDVNICGCAIEGSKGSCRIAVMDVSYYNEALTSLNDVLCESIYDETQKEACYMVVKSSVDQFEKEDPQYLADVYAATHNENAIDQYIKLIQEDNKNIDNFISLAFAYAEKGLSEQGQGNSQAPYVSKAFEAIDQAKIIDENNSNVYRAEAYVNEIKPDYDKAMQLYDKAIEIDENNILAYAGRGHLNRLRGSLMLAVEDFNKAAELNTTNDIVVIYSNLCTLEYSRSNQKTAVENCEIVTNMKNTDTIFQSDAYQVMSAIFVDNKDFIQAKNYLLQAKTLTPSESNIYVSLSDLNLYEQQYEEAYFNATKAIDLLPTRVSGYLALSRALYMQDKYEESIGEAQQGINLVNNDVSLLTSNKSAMTRDLNYTIANNYRELGDVQKQKEYEQKGNEAFKIGNQLEITK